MSSAAVKASPTARRLAEALGVDLATLTGSGPGGRIVKEDVEAHNGAGPPAAAPVGDGGPAGATVEQLSSLQRVVARRMTESNGSFRDGAFRLHERVNVGVAVAAQDALLVPVVPDADRSSLDTVARTTRELALRGRDGKLSPAELDGGTFTVSNVGMLGVRWFTAVVNVPQAAILAVGALERRPVVRDDAVVPGHVMDLVLCCDHRILYGTDAAAFLAELRANLEAPEQLL